MTGKVGAGKEGAMEVGAMEVEEDAVRVVNAGTDGVAGVEEVAVTVVIVVIVVTVVTVVTVVDVVNEEGVEEEEEEEEVVEARDWIQPTPVPSHHFRVTITMRDTNLGCLGIWVRYIMRGAMRLPLAGYNNLVCCLSLSSQVINVRIIYKKCGGNVP
jgi:hypothetical protein